MRDALPPGPGGQPRTGFTCQACGHVIITAVEGLFTNPAHGSHQRFCSPACRQAAYRRRHADVAEDAPRQHTGGRSRNLKQSQPTTQGVNIHPSLGGQISAAVDNIQSAASNARSALSSLPGFRTGDALASAAIYAMAPARMAVYDRRAQVGLELVGLSLTPKPGRYGRYMALIEQVIAEAAQHGKSTHRARD